ARAAVHGPQHRSGWPALGTPLAADAALPLPGGQDRRGGRSALYAPVERWHRSGGPPGYRGKRDRWEDALGVRLWPLLRPGAARAAQGQGSLHVDPEREEPLLPRPAASLSHLLGEGGDPGGQAARPNPADPEGG